MADADMKRCAEIGAEVFVLDAGWYNKMTYRLGQSEPSATFKPRGLDAERRYRVLENGQFQSLRSGRDLATNGIAVNLDAEWRATVIELTPTEDSGTGP